jgi:hypothetical protein
MLITACVTAAVLLGVGFLVVGVGDSDQADSSEEGISPAVAAAQRAARDLPAFPVPQLGPEGIPLQGGAPLGPASSPTKGESRGGVPCGSTEQLKYHVHARLEIYVNGKQRSVPMGVGVGQPRKVTKRADGPFVSSGSCFSELHTHASDGLIHIEAPGQTSFSLGQFFDVWSVKLDRNQLGDERGRVVAYVNGKRYRGNPRAIPLHKHAQITLELGNPPVPPSSIPFPAGL